MTKYRWFTWQWNTEAFRVLTINSAVLHPISYPASKMRTTQLELWQSTCYFKLTHVIN